MFYDYVKIFVKAGDGGNGAVTFRREKFVNLGGPNGGDGGRGGSIIFVADEGLLTLVDFKYRQHYKLPRGENGLKQNKHGANGDDLYVKVPVGTIIRNDETGEILGDIIHKDQEIVVAKGGRGGRGNARFISSKMRAPEIAENGEPGEEMWLRLELKLLADVALVGMPNAGKSTIISTVSGSKPKIADYPFTTLHPNLGVVQLEPGTSFVLADIPGLIEGAADGVGLGHRFLRHIERTRLLMHVVDMSGMGETEPWEDFKVIDNELKLYREDLAERKRIIVASKMEMPDSEENLAEFKKHIPKNKDGEDYEIYPISAVTGMGVNDLMWKAYHMLKDVPIPSGISADMKITKPVTEKLFTVTKDEKGIWQVTGKRVERLVIMTNWDHEDSLRRLQNILVKMGIDEAMREAGVQDGDDVEIAGKEFTYSE